VCALEKGKAGRLGTTGLLCGPWLGWVGEQTKRVGNAPRLGGLSGHRHGLCGKGKRLENDRLCGEAPGARRMDRRETKLLAHVHPTVEPEGDIERIEDEVARGGIEIAELGGDPGGEA